MTGSNPPSRRFNEREVALIIKRASELQEQEQPGETGTSGMSLAELEQVAREAGLDPALVRRAAADVDERVTDQPSSRFIGAPTTLRLERTIEGEVPVDEYEAIVFEIQRAIGEVGAGSTLGRSLQWVTTGGPRRRAGLRQVQISVSPRHGRTMIRIEEPIGAIAGGLFGGLMGGLGAGMGVPISALGVAATHSVAGGLAVLAGMLGGSYLLARTIFGSVAARRGARLQALMARLAEHVAATAVSVPAASPPAEPVTPARAGPGGPGGDG